MSSVKISRYGATWSLLSPNVHSTESTMSPIPAPRSSSSLAFVEGSLYVFSGENIPRVPIDNKFHIFQLSSSSWSVSSASSAPCARVGHSTVSCDGVIYLYGGRTEYSHMNTLSDFWAYNPSSDSWVRLTPENEGPGPLSYHASCGSDRNGGEVFVFGGCDEVGRSNRLYKYSVSKNNWSELSSPSSALPCARGGASLAILGDDLHVLFGYNGKEELSDHFVFSLISNDWSIASSSSLPAARSVCDVVALPLVGTKGSLFVFGGEYTPSAKGHEGAGCFHSDAWIYDVATGEWQMLNYGNLRPEGRGWMNSVKVSEREIAIMGGLSESQRFNDVWLCKIHENNN